MTVSKIGPIWVNKIARGRPSFVGELFQKYGDVSGGLQFASFVSVVEALFMWPFLFVLLKAGRYVMMKYSVGQRNLPDLILGGRDDFFVSVYYTVS